MDIETLIARLAGKPGAVLEYPFGPEAAVYKVGGKMFATFGMDREPPQVNLKCDPDEAEALRAEFTSITPGYHMNKRHWNTVILDGTVPDDVIESMIDSSYDLVCAALPKPVQDTLGKKQ
ncbi:MAG: MmcQ/YjbR family DNA-binding protein [Capsulimonadaceae bacterium]